VRPVVNLKTDAGIRTFEAIASDIANLVLEFGGALSGEHGDGLIRSPFMEKMFGPVLYGAFRQVKRTFDPDGIFNPGKIVGAPPLTSNLRYGAGYQARRAVTFFDYSEYGGMSGAVEMCSGLGVCRKKLDGTMCPSYMATREEKHSTRGRANALRLAMAGRLGESGLGDAGVREVLDLCLECRACKAECPVGVDVARFKSEFLADYWSRHGTPLRARFLGGIHDVSRWASRMAPISTRLVQSGPARWLAETLLGIDSRRTPPAWARQTFRQRFDFVGLDSVIRIFVDTFTNYYNPQVGMAGARVLRAAGLEVGLAPNGCCGRPLISQGLLGQARQAAQANTEALYPLAEQGRQFVFFEPSCLSAMREDVPSLLRGDARRRAMAVARQSMLFEEFLEQHLDRNPSGAVFKAGPGTIVLHGHCHQKAMGLLPPAKALLSRIPGATVVDLDAGCCGMAGSFGYAVEHFDVSRAIGERRLLPAARGLAPDDVLVAAGVSCRHQVADFTSARALHPAELLGTLVQETA
jgi:Fe-S oxidoreductase